MTNCTPAAIEFPSVKRRVIEVSFTGGYISSYGGIMLLREADRCSGLLSAASSCISNTRDPGANPHSQQSQLKQRVFNIALGEEDLNDHTRLRQDMALQTTVRRDQPLSSASILFRFEQRFNCKAAVDIHKVIIDQFIPPTQNHQKSSYWILMPRMTRCMATRKDASTMGIITTIVPPPLRVLWSETACQLPAQSQPG